MEEQIKTLAKILNLDTYCSKDEVAKFIVEPEAGIFQALNMLLGCQYGHEYYSGWCYGLDYLIIEIEKDTYRVIISTWKDDKEVNDAVALKGCDFETISILMTLIKQVA